MENNELTLIDMVEQLLGQQHKYFEEKRKYGNSPQQLDLCKNLERQLKAYCKKRRELLTKKQIELFS